MRKNFARFAVIAVVGGVAMSASTAAYAQTELARVTNPTNGCTYVLYGPTVTITTYPPSTGTSGGVGAGVFCP